jgi:hypothetical protein
MLRISLVTVTVLMGAALMGGVVNAQVAGDPDAAAPVIYSGTQAPGCDSDIRNADGSPVISCVADEQPQDDGYADADSGEYPQDYAYDEAPDYDTSGYYAPNFYLGISPVPYDYWSLGFGWPYYGYAAFGYGWPYFGFASYWGGRRWGGHHGDHHDGRHDHHGHDGGYHGPYRYVGHGRYWDQTHASNSNHGNHHAAGAAFNDVAAAAAVNRGNARNPGAAMGNRTRGAPLNASRFAPSASNRVIGSAGQQRAVLPSASYYAAAQASMRTGAASTPRVMPMSRGNVVNARTANQAYRVTSLPSRNYAAYARANSVYRNNSGSAARSGGYAPRSGYAIAPRAAYSAPQRYAMPQRYSMPSRAYSVQRSAPSYSRGGGSYAPRSGAAPSAHFSGSSHASNGNSRAHR